MSIHTIDFASRDQAQRRDYIEMIILIILLLLTLGFIMWIQHGYQVNFIDTLTL